MRKKRNSYVVLVGNHDGRSPFRRLKDRWVHNIKIDLKERIWEGVNCSYLIQGRDQW
jgi:hypothetical protein